MSEWIFVALRAHVRVYGEDLLAAIVPAPACHGLITAHCVEDKNAAPIDRYIRFLYCAPQTQIHCLLEQYGSER